MAVVNVCFDWTCSGVTSHASSLLPLLFVDSWGWQSDQWGLISPLLFWLAFLQQLGMLCIYSCGGGLLFKKFFLVSFKGCEENLLASWNSVVFGIYFCNPPPWEFSWGQLSLTETPGLWIRGAGQPLWSSCSYRKCLQATVFFKAHLWFLGKSASWAVD